MPDDARSSFITHLGYVEAFAWLAGLDHHTSAEDALRSLAARKADYADDRSPGAIDLDQVEKSMRHAWSTEVLLAMPRQLSGDEDEFLRLANSWVAVQTYYVGYHLAQALIVAKGQARPIQHSATQGQFASHWSGRSLVLPPWTFAVDKDGWRNLPSGVVIDDTIHPWSGLNEATAWNLAAKALRTTRDEVVADSRKRRREELLSRARKVWQEEETVRLAAGKRPRKAGPPTAKPRLTAAELRGCSERVRAFTVLDYLYRLRISANYKDSTVFHDGPQGEHESRWLHRNLTFVASSLSLATELRVQALVGPNQFETWARDFADNRMGSVFDIGIKSRLDLGLI